MLWTTSDEMRICTWHSWIVPMMTPSDKKQIMKVLFQGNQKRICAVCEPCEQIQKQQQKSMKWVCHATVEPSTLAASLLSESIRFTLWWMGKVGPFEKVHDKFGKDLTNAIKIELIILLDYELLLLKVKYWFTSDYKSLAPVAQKRSPSIMEKV